MNCRKCGAELHPDQKVCIECGERTAAGGKFDVEEDRHWRPTPQQIKIAAGAVALVLVILIGYKLLHVTPPEVIAKEWFDAMVSRQIGIAEKYVTPKLKDDLANRMMDLRALADDYYTDVVNNSATYTVGKPVYDSPTNPKRADITISLVYETGGAGRDVRVTLVKVGRAWRVNAVA